jgi:hypothetical protein
VSAAVRSASTGGTRDAATAAGSAAATVSTTRAPTASKPLRTVTLPVDAAAAVDGADRSSSCSACETATPSATPAIDATAPSAAASVALDAMSSRREAPTQRSSALSRRRCACRMRNVSR